MAATRVLELLGSRLLLLALLAGYLTVAIVSHEVPLPRGWEPVLAFLPALPAAIQMLRGLLVHWGAAESRPRVRGWAGVRRSLPLWVLFAAIAAAMVVSCNRGNVPVVCTDGPSSCARVVTYDYRSLDGAHARRHPFHEQGAPAQPWTRISEETYVAEVGTILRQAAGFGAFLLGFAFVTGEAIRLGLWRRSKKDYW